MVIALVRVAFAGNARRSSVLQKSSVRPRALLRVPLLVLVPGESSLDPRQ